MRSLYSDRKSVKDEHELALWTDDKTQFIIQHFFAALHTERLKKKIAKSDGDCIR